MLSEDPEGVKFRTPDYRGLYFFLIIIFASTLSGVSSRSVVTEGDKRADDFFAKSVSTTVNEPNRICDNALKERKYSRNTGTEAVGCDFRRAFMLTMRPEETRSTPEKPNHPLIARFRREGKEMVTRNVSTSKDYMSSYYAQRKAIMDKFNLQKNEITKRRERAEKLIAEAKRAKEAKVQVHTERNDFTQDRGRAEDTPRPPIVVTYSPDLASTVFPVPNNGADLRGKVNLANRYHSTIPDINFNDTQTATPESKGSFTDPIEEGTLKNSSDFNLYFDEDSSPTVATPRLLENNDIDLVVSERNSLKQKRDNETLIVDLGAHLTASSRGNESTSEELESIFQWETPATDKTFTRPNTVVISANGQSDNSSQALASQGSMVKVETSPEVHVTKSIENVKTDTMVYRNSTHEIVAINGAVSSIKRIDDVPANVDQDMKNRNMTDSTMSGTAEIGGARESEWCEECPHDYRWGECEGILFYQHNIFLRNRGPSAVDAVFGMDTEGPVYITCVEALRYNQTRGIVSLHSGGPAHNFAKLRVRGFHGEGFSYIMKVWGVSSEKFHESTSYQ
ncbi:uncharacterized protein LOC124187133 isoform X1 [Neodiprion fabricii]|uniref:uncharacterized protein LOC124187133 isoform X1 n=1 Tax=Neodiprion fabricii TaxID=2872261 RepID=UPI001ED9702E|nr:uncharacterized protein LOC124187133 isoform X1 [Neodiprion fabricii]